MEAELKTKSVSVGGVEQPDCLAAVAAADFIFIVARRLSGANNPQCNPEKVRGNSSPIPCMFMPPPVIYHAALAHETHTIATFVHSSRSFTTTTVWPEVVCWHSY